jgi:3'-5' exonuclease
MLAELRDILFLDIETVANQYDYNSLDERLKIQWARKANFFKRDNQLTDEDVYHDRAGIYAEFGRVVCVAVGKFVENESGEVVLRTKAYYGDNEKALLIDFKNMLEKMDPNTKLCAHNGKEFDFPLPVSQDACKLCSASAASEYFRKKSLGGPAHRHHGTLEVW